MPVLFDSENTQSPAFGKGGAFCWPKAELSEWPVPFDRDQFS